MSRGGSARGGSSSPRPGVHVQRRLAGAQPEISNFLDEAARHIAGQIGGVLIGNLYTLHMTLLESAGTASAFRHTDHTPGDVRRFSAALDQHLGNIEGTSDSATVTVDPERPLRWYGCMLNRLALNIVHDEKLQKDREHIEAFLRQHFGRVPRLRPLDEHIVIGTVNPNAISKEARQDPTSLLPEGIVIPRNVLLNGLVVFLDGVSGAAS